MLNVYIDFNTIACVELNREGLVMLHRHSLVHFTSTKYLSSPVFIPKWVVHFQGYLTLHVMPLFEFEYILV